MQVLKPFPALFSAPFPVLCAPLNPLPPNLVRVAGHATRKSTEQAPSTAPDVLFRRAPAPTRSLGLLGRLARALLALLGRLVRVGVIRLVLVLVLVLGLG